MSTNNKISNLISSQVPFFVRNDHQQFITFIEKYYEFLEQTDGVLDVKNNIRSFNDIDYLTRNTTPTNLEIEFQEKLYASFMKLIPSGVKVDKALLLKHIKDFYLSRGSEKSIRFLLNILFSEENVEFYYPKSDILKASDGKWYVQRSLRVNGVGINSQANNDFSALEKFQNRTVYGNTSLASATVERVDRFFEKGTRIDELILSGIRGSFKNGEAVYAVFDDINSQTSMITANVFGGIIVAVDITAGGSGYSVGDHPIITTSTGIGGDIVVDKVSTGNIQSITILNGGAGYHVEDLLLISGAGGSGANANVTIVLDDSSVHPNSYNIISSQIYLEQNTAIGNARYSNLVSSVTDPANNFIANSMNYFVYSNTGPAKFITVISRGSGYTGTPSITIAANTRVRELGILGRMEIINGGQGYRVGDTITFTNLVGGYGTGAAGNVKNVAANGYITQVEFKPVFGQITGGTGYSTAGVPKYPIANVISTNASAYGANVVVTNLLGEGGTFIIANSTIGAIESLTILSGGSGYSSGNTYLDFTTLGDGKAKANVTVVEGSFTYPGRYLNDDGFLSASNYLEDRDYYQNFSYVIRTGVSIESYRKALKNLVHPAGMKLFGQYMFEDMNDSMAISNAADDIVYTANKYVSYTIANNVIINYTAHGLTNANSVYVQFTSGNIANYAANVVTYTPNAIFRVANVINSDAFTIYSGKYLPGSMNIDLVIAETAPTGIYMKEDGYNMFVVGTNTDLVLDFKLSRQYDITTAVLDKRSAATTTYDPAPNDLTFKPDGTMLYLTGINNDRITQYSMSEAWNVNTATYLTSFNVSSTSGYTSPIGLNLSRDGQYLYIIDSVADELVQFSMSTAWYVNTASYLTKKYVGGFETNGSAVYFRANGDSLFIVGSTNDVIREFRLSTAWNVNTATIYANSGVLTGFAPSASGLTFANNGSMVYLTDATYDLIHQLPMTEAWNVNTAFNGTTTTGNVIIGKVVSV